MCFCSEHGLEKLKQWHASMNRQQAEDELEDKVVPVEAQEDDENADPKGDAAGEGEPGQPGEAEPGAGANDEGEDLDGRDDEFAQVEKEIDPWMSVTDPPFEVKWARRRIQNWAGDPLPWSEFNEGEEREIYEMYIYWDEHREDYNDRFDHVDDREKDESFPEKRGRSSMYYSQRESKPITLESCMATFTETEILGEDNLWYCNKCREHQRASKTMEIWSSNDILIIHLKRFKYTKWNREKIDREVVFPLEGFDISPWVVDKEASREACLYDLYGVSNHSGGLGGGHYTAYVRNLISGDWFSCNDSYCSRVTDLDMIFGPEAYLLFYKRRNPISGPRALSSFASVPDEKTDPVHDEKIRDDLEEEEIEAASPDFT